MKSDSAGTQHGLVHFPLPAITLLYCMSLSFCLINTLSPDLVRWGWGLYLSLCDLSSTYTVFKTQRLSARHKHWVGKGAWSGHRAQTRTILCFLRKSLRLLHFSLPHACVCVHGICVYTCPCLCTCACRCVFMCVHVHVVARSWRQTSSSVISLSHVVFESGSLMEPGAHRFS